MLIKVARLGNQVEEVALSNGDTVQQALDAAGLTLDNEDIKVGSEVATTSRVLHNGEIVTIVPKVKGGQNCVKVARLGDRVQEVILADNATVQDALDAADINVDNEEIRLDNTTVGLNTRVRDKQLVTVVPKVKGGK